MNDLKFVKAVQDDVEDILYFINELAKFEKLENQVKTNKEELMRNVFENKYAEVLFLEVDSRRIGFALYFYTFSTFEGKPTLYLEDLFVVSEERQKGYGKKTLEHLANIAIEKGCARFEWSCLNWNQNAIDFYLKFGAKRLSDWDLFRLEGANLVRYIK